MPGWQGDRGSRHERGYGADWVKLRLRILRRDGYLCQQCRRDGRPTPATDVDHIIPKAKDGTDDPDNLEALCKPCHKAKTAREALEAQGIKPRPRYGADGWPVWD